jgi:hypothetical protein
MATPLLSTDPIDIPIDPLTGDVVFTEGDLVLTTGHAAVAQGIWIALSDIRGEWFADLDDGVPWLANDSVPDEEAILGGKFDELRVSAAIREAILGVPGVAEIVTLVVSFDAATRALSISWVVRTSFGDTIADTFAAGA